MGVIKYFASLMCIGLIISGVQNIHKGVSSLGEDTPKVETTSPSSTSGSRHFSQMGEYSQMDEVVAPVADLVRINQWATHINGYHWSDN